MATVDVTILGAGVMGLTCALACLKRGATVQVIDPHGPASGASGGIVGALAPHTPDNWNPKKQFQFESLIMGRDFWPWVEAISGMPTGYQPNGRIQPVMTEKQLPMARVRAENAVDLWQGLARWTVRPVSDASWEPPSPTGFVIEDTLSAHLHPRQATLAMAGAVRALGGQFGDTPQGLVLDATGWAGLKALSDEMGREAGNGVKGQAALLDFDAAGHPQIFADGIYIVPHHDGTVAIGSTSEREFDAPYETDTQLDDVLTKAHALIPALERAPILERWAGVRPRAKSRAPMLGRHPIHPDTFFTNGAFKIGFGMAPKIGEVMADLILEGRDTIPEPFRVEASL